MTVYTLFIVGAVLLVMGLGERVIRTLPLSPALVYLAVGWSIAWFGGGLASIDLREHAPTFLQISEAALLFSLFAIGIRVGTMVVGKAWNVALLLATVGLLLTCVLVAGLAIVVLDLPFAGALLLAAILAPTDPVLASDVQIRSSTDRDAVRLTLTLEGALNDGTAFPVVMLALGLLGLHELGAWGQRWWLRDLFWPVLGGALLGCALGHVIRRMLLGLTARAHTLEWDELLYLGIITLAYCLATVLHMSTFITVFACGWALFRSHARADTEPREQLNALRSRMSAFGARLERLVEVLMVMLLGAALATVRPTWSMAVFALACICVARPLAALGVTIWNDQLVHQKRLVAWFGIRGVGSRFYLCVALQHRPDESLTGQLIGACLISIAASIVLHGISATPLMQWHHRHRPNRKRQPDATE